MQTIAIPVENSRQKDVVSSFNREFVFESKNRPLTDEERICLLENVRPEEKNDILSGRSMLVMRSKFEFSNNGDSVVSIDYDVVDDVRMRKDPLIIMKCKPNSKTPQIVRGVLEEVVKVDLIGIIFKSMQSGEFNRSVLDLSRILGEPREVVYKKCVDTVISSLTEGFRSTFGKSATVCVEQQEMELST